MTEPWGHAEKNAYKLGIEKGRKLAAQEATKRELPSLLDRFAMAALTNLDGHSDTAYAIAFRAYDIANAMMAVRQKRREIDEEIPF